MNTIKIGNMIKWESSAGTCVGKVVDIKLDFNAKSELCPWLTIHDVIVDGLKSSSEIVLNGNHNYLTMMKAVVL